MNAGLDRGQLWLLEGLVDADRAIANPNGRAGAPEALNAQQLAFVDAYLRSLNATQAAVEAGYSRKTAKQIGSRLLSNVVLRAELKRRLELVRNAAQLTVEGVLEKLRQLTNADVRHLYKPDGTWKDIHDWPDDISGRIMGVETRELFEEQLVQPEDGGKPRKMRVLIGYVKNVKLTNPNESLKVIAQYLKMLVAEGGMSPAGAIDADYEALNDEELREAALRVAMRAKALPASADAP